MITNSPDRREVGRPRVFDDAAVFEATARALARLGHARLTLAAVAAELGSSAPALSKRFGSKRGLLLAFADWSLEASRERFRQARETPGLPLEGLLARFLMPAGARIDEGADPSGLAHVAALYVDYAADPALRDVAARRVRLFEEEITALLAEALAAGELAGCDVHRLGRLLHSAFVGAALTWAADPSRPGEAWLREVFEGVIGPYRAAGAVPSEEAGPPA